MKAPQRTNVVRTKRRTNVLFSRCKRRSELRSYRLTSSSSSSSSMRHSKRFYHLSDIFHKIFIARVIFKRLTDGGGERDCVCMCVNGNNVKIETCGCVQRMQTGKMNFKKAPFHSHTLWLEFVYTTHKHLSRMYTTTNFGKHKDGIIHKKRLVAEIISSISSYLAFTTVPASQPTTYIRSIFFHTFFLIHSLVVDIFIFFDDSCWWALHSVCISYRRHGILSMNNDGAWKIF